MKILRVLPWLTGLAVVSATGGHDTDILQRRLQSGNDTGVLDRRLQRRSGNDTGIVETRLLRRSASDTEPRRRASATYTWEYVGCYRDNSERDFKHGPYHNGYSNSGSGDTGRSYTKASCMDACVRHGGYTYFALQDGDPSYGHHLGGGQCFCDNSYGTPISTYQQLDDSECGGPGDYGRGWANSVYAIHTSEDTGYTFVGCYKDDGWRDLDYGPSKETWGLKGFDHESCLAACSGYKYFALQSHGECFCDNSYGTPSSTYYGLDPKKCGGTLGLGGPLANAVYQRTWSEASERHKSCGEGDKRRFHGTDKTLDQCKALCLAESDCQQIFGAMIPTRAGACWTCPCSASGCTTGPAHHPYRVWESYRVLCPACKNGGVVKGSVAAGTCGCDCPTGWTGSDCATRVPCSACKNGGVVKGSVAAGTCGCDCPTGWTGSDCGSQANSGSCLVEPNYDYPGSDIRFVPNTDSAAMCASICANEPLCKSWTYVDNISHQFYKRCFLKHARQPNRRSNSCCSSGLPCGPVSRLPLCPALSNNKGRCGPGIGRCNKKIRDSAKWCNADDGTCGNTAAHKTAQHDDTYDWRPTSCQPPESIPWTTLYAKGTYGSMLKTKEDFNKLAQASGGIIRRECSLCSPTHRDVYFKRKTNATSYDYYEGVLVTWSDEGFHTDFDIFSNIEDAMNGVNAWEYCNGGHRHIGFPRDCGPKSFKARQWNSFRGGQKNIRWSAWTADKCAVFDGVLHQDGKTCCDEACGAYCGAPNCNNGPGGASACCGSVIPDDDICGPNQHAPCTIAATYDLVANGVFCGEEQYRSNENPQECEQWCTNNPNCLAFVTYEDSTCDSCIAYTSNDCSAAYQQATSCEGTVSAYHKHTPVTYEYVGCYKDSWPRDFQHFKGRGFDQDRCMKACAGYDYFALQLHGECFCDYSYGTPRSKYPHLPDDRCGGPSGRGRTYTNSVYAIRVHAERLS